jgi:hypothetical protein
MRQAIGSRYKIPAKGALVRVVLHGSPTLFQNDSTERAATRLVGGCGAVARGELIGRLFASRTRLG